MYRLFINAPVYGNKMISNPVSLLIYVSLFVTGFQQIRYLWPICWTHFVFSFIVFYLIMTSNQLDNVTLEMSMSVYHLFHIGVVSI